VKEMSEVLRGYFSKTVILACPRCGKEEKISNGELDQNILNRFLFFDLIEETENRNIWQCRTCGARFYTERR